MIQQWEIGTATGNETITSARPLNGIVRGVYIDYQVTPNAATDVVLATTNAPAKTVLTVTNNATDGWYYPHAIMQDDAAADVTYDGTNEIYVPIAINDYLSITTTGADSDQETTVYVLLEC